MSKIENPMKFYYNVPDNLSRKSSIISVKTESLYNGIVFNSPGALGEAVVDFASDHTVRDMLYTRKKMKGRNADVYAPVFFTAPEEFSSDVVEKLILPDLNSGKNFYQDFKAREEKGTNLCRNYITAKIIGKEYVLNINTGDAELTNDIEKYMANKLGKHMALVNQKVTAVVDRVDDWWFNVDMMDVLKEVPARDVIYPSDSIFEKMKSYFASKEKITKRLTDNMASYISQGGTFLFKNDGVDYRAYAQILPNEIRNHSGDKRKYVKNRGSSIVGGAFHMDGKLIIVDPSIGFSISELCQPDSYFIGVSKDEISSVQRASEALAKMIKP